MKIFRLSLLLFIGSLLTFSVIAQESGYVYQGEKDGIKVFFKEANDSPIKELKLTMYFEAKMSTIVAVLNDIKEIPSWVYKTSDAKMVKRVSDREYYYYNKLDFPWPLSDRDLILHSTFTQDPETRIAKSTSVGVPTYSPINDGVVRIPETHIEWILYPTVDDRIKLEYYLRSDPGGAIPAWVVNLAVDHGPIKSMSAFRDMLKKEKYIKQEFAFVID